MNENDRRLRGMVATAAGSPALRGVVRCLLGCAIKALSGRIHASGSTDDAVHCRR
ncbi:hypothetical protein H7X46_26650 [Pseudonocardia sp. C8]|uniref:hypothetical protein n=1 Tax=Pseudonocardia sp. C8 TaxID=2762759 RepID=UPI001642F657|nr:hypothetical protein [Pseudonocardia sp. C8]MBC3194634.1 hypothetical protein [Pseudonocardia sp. C8]